MDMSAAKLLSQRAAEREALLQRALATLQADPRVRAAWLFGSSGRGDQDALSDLDLFVVVAEEAIAEICAGRQEFVGRIGTPALRLEAPQNAPPGGAYLMALYDGQTGAHAVDWYWQPQSLARIPQDARVLLDRVGLPRLDAPTRFDYQSVPERAPVEAATQAVNSFWAALLITAKYVARSPWGDHGGLLRWACGSLEAVGRFVGSGGRASLEEGLPSEPTERVQALRELGAQMEALMPQVAARGGSMPWEAIPSVYRFLDLVEAVVAEKAAARKP
ncbi:MAG TPA: nucleotidyltransferase domain-containing protein [Chthonomonadaceae bacterium]|nr:nucleotidyltransferase domain-containing protein [Chthonomonadaceae bacterium]